MKCKVVAQMMSQVHPLPNDQLASVSTLYTIITIIFLVNAAKPDDLIAAENKFGYFDAPTVTDVVGSLAN